MNKRRQGGDAIEIKRQSGRDRVEREVHFGRPDDDLLYIGESVRVRHGERKTISSIPAEVMTRSRDGKAPACYTADRSAGMNMSFVEEIDVPSEGGGRQWAVVGIGGVAAKR